jgi:hypothetical protein
MLCQDDTTLKNMKLAEMTHPVQLQLYHLDNDLT